MYWSKSRKNLYMNGFWPAEQLYLSLKVWFYLTKVLKLRSKFKKTENSIVTKNVSNSINIIPNVIKIKLQIVPNLLNN